MVQLKVLTQTFKIFDHLLRIHTYCIEGTAGRRRAAWIEVEEFERVMKRS